jgi:F-box and WD-40 domain protein 1/11
MDIYIFSSVYCLEFDSSRIFTGSRDRTIKAWDLATGKPLGTFWGHAGSVLCLKFSHDWERDPSARRPGTLVSGSSDCSVLVWNLTLAAGGEVRAEVRGALKPHGGGVLDLRMDEDVIVSCSKDAAVRIWDRHTLELKHTLRGHEGPVNAVGLQGRRVVSASGDGRLIVWDVRTGARMRTLEGHERGLACVAFESGNGEGGGGEGQGEMIVSGSNDCTIRIWDAATGACVRTLTGHTALVRALACDPATGRLVSASYDRTIKVWDLRTGVLLRDFKGEHASHIFDVRFDAQRIVR